MDKKVWSYAFTIILIFSLSLIGSERVESKQSMNAFNKCCVNGYSLWNMDGTLGFETCGCNIVNDAHPTQTCSCNSEPGESD